MNSIPNKNLSPLAESALNLDSDFSLLEQITRQLENAEIESDYGFDHARKLLARFGECGERVGERVQVLARSLEEARIKAESHARSVALIAEKIQERYQVSEQMHERFNALGQRVRGLTQAIAEMKRPEGTELSDDEKAGMTEKIPALNTELLELYEESCLLRDEAREKNLKSLEKNAHALGQSLNSAQNRLKTFVPVASL